MVDWDKWEAEVTVGGDIYISDDNQYNDERKDILADPRTAILQALVEQEGL